MSRQPESRQTRPFVAIVPNQAAALDECVHTVAVQPEQRRCELSQIIPI
jgi:hypothetical protein